MPDNKSRNNKSEIAIKTVKILLGISAIALAVFLTVYFFPQISRLKDAEVRDEMRDFIHERKAAGLLIMLGIQLLQVILSVIPGEPVEVMFGFIYGPWLGAALCILGLTLGTFAVFCVTRAMGRRFMSRVEESGKYGKLTFLKEPSKRDTLIFLLFFLPGTPKDTLTYFAPFTGIELWKFMLISGIARIPSVVTSTFAGDSIFDGEYLSSIVIFCVTGLIGLIGIFIYNRLSSKQ